MAKINYVPPKEINIKPTRKGATALSKKNIYESSYLKEALEVKKRNYLQASKKIANFNIKNIKTDESNLSETGLGRDFLSKVIYNKSNLSAFFENNSEEILNQIKTSIFDSIQYYDGINELLHWKVLNLRVNKIFIDEGKQEIVSFIINNIINKSYINLHILISELINIVSTVQNGVNIFLDLLPTIIISAINVYLTVDELDDSYIPFFKAFITFDSAYDGIDRCEYINKVKEFEENLSETDIDKHLKKLYTKKIIQYDETTIVLNDKIHLN